MKERREKFACLVYSPRFNWLVRVGGNAPLVHFLSILRQRFYRPPTGTTLIGLDDWICTSVKRFAVNRITTLPRQDF